jgi:hypothetical protein
LLEQLFNGKIRIQLLTKLLLNPASKVYLRGLERDLGVSSNTVRLELNKLFDLKLIEASEDFDNSKVKYYSINQSHPLFQSMRGIILQFVGLDQIMDKILNKVGNLEQVFLTGDLAEGKNTSFVDLVLVGDVDKTYLYQLIEKIEPLIQKKIRVALISPLEYSLGMLDNVDNKMQLL